VGANSPFADPTYVVHVRLADPSAATRIGCPDAYGGTSIWKSPDARFLYIATNSLRCPVFEKRNLRQPGFPIVVATELGNPNTGANTGRHAMSPDGRYVFGQELDVISTKTLWSLGTVGGFGLPMASTDPTRFYASSFNIVRTMSATEFRILGGVTFPCVFVERFGGAEARISRDESKVYVLGHDGGVCAVVMRP
jgi:hypothetical protein